MTKRRMHTILAGASVALAAMPAAACPGKGKGFGNPDTPSRVKVNATADGFAIGAKMDARDNAPRPSVPLGVQTQIDLAAFECSSRRLASAPR